jgi:hypothetical protein
MIRKEFLGLGLALLTVPASAVTIVSAGDSYKYVGATSLESFVGSLVNWQDPSYDDTGWHTGSAVFSNVGGIGSNPQNTYWEADHDPKLRKHVNLTDNLLNAQVKIAVDNGFDLYINGTFVATANAEGFTYYWEYDFPVTASLFHPGDNLIALQLEDHGGATAFDMEITGDYEVSSVPEPATYVALGLGALALIRRRKLA